LMTPESATQSVTDVGGADAIVLRQPVRDYGSHSPNHDVEGGDESDGGGVNEGPTWCTTKKACHNDQYRALTLDGSKEDSQAGFTGKPYSKKSCGVDQYDAPPMDGSKDGQAEAPTVVPAEVPVTTAVAQGLAVLATVPAASMGLAVSTRGHQGHSHRLRGREGRSEGCGA
jgi:hypothetical protein